MMRALSICAAAVTAAASPEFAMWMTQFGKSYTGAEYTRRLAIFEATVAQIAAHKAKLGAASWMGLNEFSAMTKEEFAAERLLPKMPAANATVDCLANGFETNARSFRSSATPTAWDWTAEGKVNAIQNQEQCGSCWAFSTVATLESAWAVKTGKLVKLSEQEVVDCSKSCTMDGGVYSCNAGCGGGWMWSAYLDIAAWKGLNTEAAYPYTAQDGTCAPKSAAFAPVSNYTCLSGDGTPAGTVADEDGMAAFSSANGPLSIAMDAGILQTYSGGILNPSASECSTNLDHAIVIVGWGVQGSTPYWKVRNSWGTAWGEKGYFRIIRGKGACGLNAAVVYPIVNA